METTIEGVINSVLKQMTGADKLRFRNTKESDLILYHHGFGTQIRNTFGLWSGNPKLVKDAGFSEKDHPDEISMGIIKAIWERLQN